MVDPVIPTATYSSTNSPWAANKPNAYLDTVAKGVKKAYLNGVYGYYSGTYWHPVTKLATYEYDASKILSGDFVVQVSSADIEGVAGNGLIYSLNGGDLWIPYYPSNFLPSSAWTNVCDAINSSMNSTNVCAKRNMRVLLYSESTMTISNPKYACSVLGTPNGVPPHPQGYTLLSTGYTGDNNTVLVYNSDSIWYADVRYHQVNIRCVR